LWIGDDGIDLISLGTFVVLRVQIALTLVIVKTSCRSDFLSACKITIYILCIPMETTMQKRRGHHNNFRLPMTEADAVKMSGGMNIIFGTANSLPGKPRRRKVRAGGGAAAAAHRQWNNRRLWGVAIGLVMVVTGVYWRTSSSDTDAAPDEGGSKNRWKRILHRHAGREQKEAPLAHFATLQYPLKHAKLVGLYFAASWCPHSTPVTEALEEYFQKTILPPLDEEDGPPEEQASLAIVHVSSDKKEDQFLDYVRKNWITVPFGSDEQTALKRHFSTCAKYEMEALGIERKHEIPTLLIIDSETQTVLTANGADDLDEYEDKALDHWMELHNLVRAMEEKYTGEEENKGGIAVLNRRRRPQRANDQNIHSNNAEAISSLFGPK
jgi:hypothetical protein